MNAAIQLAIEQREKGQVPISIGTSLAIEAGAGVYPDRPESPAPFSQVHEVWFNVRTIVRNLLACLPTELRNSLLPEDAWPAALEELSIIPAAVTEASHGHCRTVFYLSDYKGLARKFPGASLREPKTEKQLFQHRLEEGTLKLLLKNNHSAEIQFFDFEITGQHPTALLVTHLPVDLLARYRFERLALLESHTGKIKGPAAWNTKLTGGKDLTNIPFNKFTLQLYGDNGNMFNPQPAALRKQIEFLAHRWQWTNATTLDRVRETIKKVDNDVQRNALLQLL